MKRIDGILLSLTLIPINDFELKKGGQFIKVSDNFIVLKGLKFNNMNTNPNEKASYWKITDKTPIFCKLNDNDKLNDIEFKIPEKEDTAFKV